MKLVVRMAKKMFYLDFSSIIECLERLMKTMGVVDFSNSLSNPLIFMLQQLLLFMEILSPNLLYSQFYIV